MRDIDVSTVQGLSRFDALNRLQIEGYNELPSAKKRGVFHIAFEIVTEPIFLLLVASGVLYLFLEDVTEAMILLSFVFVIIGITVYQERKTENAWRH